MLILVLLRSLSIGYLMLKNENAVSSQLGDYSRFDHGFDDQGTTTYWTRNSSDPDKRNFVGPIIPLVNLFVKRCHPPADLQRFCEDSKLQYYLKICEKYINYFKGQVRSNVIPLSLATSILCIKKSFKHSY
jgi:hypothetical protein